MVRPRARERQGQGLQTRTRLARGLHLHPAPPPGGFSRLAYIEPLDDETAATTIGIFWRARAFFASHGISRLVRVVTDNGGNYRARAFTRTVTGLASRRQRIRPYTLRPGGKVERYNRILAEECLYACECSSETQRRGAIAVWNNHDNYHRPHTACRDQAPESTPPSTTSRPHTASSHRLVECSRVVTVKTVILAGGRGTRLGRLGQQTPKAMVDIGGYPMIWHIMRLYEAHGIEDFVVCCGHLGNAIRNYFANYLSDAGEVRIDLSKGETVMLTPPTETWRVTLVDTGQDTMTGGRLRRVRHHLEDDMFCMTYADGLTDLNLRSEVDFHGAHGRAATVLAVRHKSQFGVMSIGDEGRVERFAEKPQPDVGRINGGFFVLNPSVFSLLHDDGTVWEHEPMRALAEQGELVGYEHDGFWQCMDTVGDVSALRELWASGRAPWRGSA